MRWTDLHRERLGTFGDVLVYSMPSERRKHGIAHALPLPPMAEKIVEALKPLTGEKEHVLDGWTLGRELYWWRRTIKPRVLKEGAANFTRHDLRRSAASGMTHVGAPAHAADTVLGHVIKGSGRNYIHGARLLEAAGALWAWGLHLEQLVDQAASGARVLSFEARA
jgi:integrase